MREAELLNALAQGSYGIQITLLPSGKCIIDTSYLGLMRCTGTSLMDAALATARKVLVSDLPEDAPVRKALQNYGVRS